MKTKKEETMRKIACVVIALLLGVFLSASIVFAGNMYAPKFKNRIVAQQKRINQGRASGCLTRAEAGTLQRNLKRIMVADSFSDCFCFCS